MRVVVNLGVCMSTTIYVASHLWQLGHMVDNLPGRFFGNMK